MLTGSVPTELDRVYRLHRCAWACGLRSKPTFHLLDRVSRVLRVSRETALPLP